MTVRNMTKTRTQTPYERSEAPTGRATRWQACSHALGALLVGAVSASAWVGEAVAESFTTFESGQVRPLAMSPSGARLYAVNTPDNRLEVFQIGPTRLTPLGSIPVGMEPVAVTVRDNGDIWVVNHLSDNISVLSPHASGLPRVIRTINTGDEPRDIVAAGPDGNRMFVTTAHRGQNSPVSLDPQVSRARADVWVFDADNLGEAPQILEIFGDTPRALAVTPDGATVYAAIFNSGNKTSVISKETVATDLPLPVTNVEGKIRPLDAGLIVREENGVWVDTIGRDWSDSVRIDLPDWDVFAFNATGETVTQNARARSVGTTIFNLAVNPTNGNLYISNQDALNIVQFEGPGEFFPTTTVRGHFVESQISVIDDNTVKVRHLNKHIDYDSFPGTQQENDNALATPLGMVISGDGQTLYVAAFGSSKVGIFSPDEIDNDTFTPDAANHIEVSGGGPTGLVLDEVRNNLYVLTRFDNSISLINLDGTPQEVDHVAMYNPEPASVVEGRPFLYDARFTSSRGDSSCGGCHIFGDLDHLAWDLGNPDGLVADNLNPMQLEVPAQVPNEFHPMKGPMTTQSFRGMTGSGPMHWRGDRTGGGQPGGDPLDEVAAFKAFNVAFEGLIGRTSPLTDEEMTAFTEFALQITYPPNPIRNLDNSLTPAQARGLDIFNNILTDGDNSCNDCHVLDPAAGRFGTAGFSVIRRNPGGDFRQPFKIPQLRNMYTKIGFFGTSRSIGDDISEDTGNQVRGFGYAHDGVKDTMFTFLQDFQNMTEEDVEDVVEMVLALDSNLAPIVGQQVTLAPGNFSLVRGALIRMLQRSAISDPVEECDLVAHGVVSDEARGYFRQANGRFQSDRAAETPLSIAQVFFASQVAGQQITLTCVPPGAGTRVALDRDEDGFFDRDEIDAGTDPADPASTPAG